MTARSTPRKPKATSGSSSGGRLHGVDAARGLALLGMMATHLLPIFESDSTLTPTWIGLVFSGRASALFAVLAGVGLALSTGREIPRQGSALGTARRGVAMRALVIAVIGLTLGSLEVNLAIILVNYAFLFLCALPFLGLRAKPLFGWALGWILVSPVLAYLTRPWLLAADPPLQLGHNAVWDDLATPGALLADVFFTGYYPVLQWISYFLVGLAVGRLSLASKAMPVILLASGAVVAIAAKALGTFLMEDAGGRQAVEAVLADPRYPVESLLQVNMTGVDQQGSWWWLASAAPHSGTTLDLLHTASTAVAVLGVFLLIGVLARWLNLDLLLPLRGAGAMTLTLYTAHVWAAAAAYRQPLPPGWTDDGVYFAHAATAVLVGMIFIALNWRGPLEWLAHAARNLGGQEPAAVRK